ncbi:hypothetical protein ACVW07_002620 [Cellulomonas sp. URHB0016]
MLVWLVLTPEGAPLGGDVVRATRPDPAADDLRPGRAHRDHRDLCAPADIHRDLCAPADIHRDLCAPADIELVREPHRVAP